MRNVLARITAGESAPGPIAALILQWQQMGDHDALETLLATVSPLVRKAAARALRRRGIRDTGAVDDTLCLVFDHIRRLPSMPDVNSLQTFVPSRSHANCHAGDAGSL